MCFSHLKEHVKEEYIDSSKLDDNQLMMQYFKKYDTDNNRMLDGLELLNAIMRMEGEKNTFNANVLPILD